MAIKSQFVDVWGLMRFNLFNLFFLTCLIVAGVGVGLCQSTNGWDQLQVATMWGLASDLWNMGGLCALICAVCFFARS